MRNNHQGWLCILNRENFEIVKDKKIYGIPPNFRAFKQLKEVGTGDTLIFYVMTPVKCIKGISRATSRVYDDQKLAPWKDRLYPHRIKTSEVKEVRIRLRDFVDKIHSVKRRIPRGTSLIRLTDRDLDMILSLC